MPFGMEQAEGDFEDEDSYQDDDFEDGTQEGEGLTR